jgi:hypothetical protein
MTPCDPMAVAVDWLDAYRAARINQIVGMYSADAVIECACEGCKIIYGREGIAAIGDTGSLKVLRSNWKTCRWAMGPWWFPIEPAAVSFRRC